ncbi:uncharacterized protein LOC136030640 [Artemia franciscana]|uniref:uncharacterized protein LOC136030640 n=1 Tax=Artemia franciscana TaxID=6661 RepID=UPI0032DBA793
MRILSFNTQSVKRVKKDLIENFAKNKEIDIICLQETWLTSRDTCLMKDFHIIRKDREEGRRGGLITAIKKTVYHQVLNFGSLVNQKVEVLLCRVYRYRKPALILANVYNPEGNNMDLETVFDLVKNAVKPTEEFLIVGDFNAHSDIWCGCGNKNGSGNALEKILEGQDEIILLTPYGLPTRANPHRGLYSTIDLAFACGRMATKT